MTFPVAETKNIGIKHLSRKCNKERELIMVVCKCIPPQINQTNKSPIKTSSNNIAIYKDENIVNFD
jgi:hypothetical protein